MTSSAGALPLTIGITNPELGHRYYEHNVAVARLWFEYAGLLASTTFHLADTLEDPATADFAPAFDALVTAWRSGYAGHQAPLIWQVHDASFFERWIHYLRYADRLLQFARTVNEPRYFGQDLSNPLPPNVTVPLQLVTRAPGRRRVGWSFVPFLGQTVVDAHHPALVDHSAGAGLVDAYHGLIQAVKESTVPQRYVVCVFRRDGRVIDSSGDIVWWDEVIDVGLPTRRIADLSRRLPGHKPRR